MENRARPESISSRFVAHPFLFALYPVLAQFATNRQDLALNELWRPAMAALIIAAILLGLGRLATRRCTKGGLLASVLILGLFVLWGTFFKDFLYGIGERFDVKVRYLFLVYLAILVGILFWVALRKGEGRTATKFLNAVAGALVLMALGQVFLNRGGGERPVEPLEQTPRQATQEPAQPRPSETPQRPDIYFIVLDGYLRADTLRESYGFDNSPFLDAMGERGFRVVEKSHVSYDATRLSLTACLNMDFLQHIAAEKGYDTILDMPLMQMFHSARVYQTLREKGYILAGLESGFRFTDPGDEFDEILAYEPPWRAPTRFEILLLDFTPFLRVLRYAGVDFGHTEWRRRMLFNLEHLHAPAEARPENPVYVQAHILAPHAPFVFSADGGLAEPAGVFSLLPAAELEESPQRLARLYVDQIKGLNRHVLEMVDRILALDKPPPVIAIVSDHGTSYLNKDEVYRNLILLHVPGIDADGIPSDLNLVHVFPVIFNHAFGSDIPMPEEPDGPFSVAN